MTGRPTRPLVAVAGRPLAAGKISGWRNAAVGVPVAYVEALHRAGGEEAILLPVELGEDEAARRLARFDALLLLGGGDVHPSLYGEEPADGRMMGLDAMSDAFEIPLARAAVMLGLPTLAVCRGLQVLNVALGGTLLQHIETAGVMGSGGGLGFLGFASALHAAGEVGPAPIGTPHFPPRAKRVIHLFMNGGPFGPDFFDPKPGPRRCDDVRAVRKADLRRSVRGRADVACPRARNDHQNEHDKKRWLPEVRRPRPGLQLLLDVCYTRLKRIDRWNHGKER